MAEIFSYINWKFVIRAANIVLGENLTVMG